MNALLFLCRHRAITLLVLLSLGSAAARAQPEPQEQPKNDSRTVYVPAIGMEGFRYILHRRGLEPVQSIHDVDDRTVIVVLGVMPRNVSDIFPNVARGAPLLSDIFPKVAQGASLLIATDRSSSTFGRSELDALGVTITGAHVHAPKSECYRKNDEFPFVWPFESRPNPDALGRVFEGFTPDKHIEPYGSNAIATNETSFLNIIKKGPNSPRMEPQVRCDRLARYSNGSSWESEGIIRLLDPDRDFFAAGGWLGKRNGRFLVLADHSIFINWMILKDDIANREFIHSSMDYLQGPVGSADQKTKCLFIEDGEIKTDFDLPVREPEIPWPDVLAKAMTVFETHGDRIVSELEERDFFNKTLLAGVNVRDVQRGGLIALTLCLLAFAFVRLLRSRVAPDPARTLVTPELAAMIPRGPLLKQRFAGQLYSDNLYEAARNMARDFFSSMGVEPDSKESPALIVSDQHPNAPELRSKIGKLWDLGFGTQPQRIRARDWRDLCADLKKILAEADSGWWKFVGAS